MKFYVVSLSLLMSLLVVSPASAVQQDYPWDLARVIEVFDGDTISVRLLQDSSKQTVRLLGIEAFEVKNRSNGATACGALAAKKELKKILKKGDWVQLRSANSSATSKGRMHRTVIKADAQGNYTINVQHEMLRRGMALWKSNKSEWTNNRSNYEMMTQAVGAGRGIWSGKLCKKSAQPNTALALAVNYDAPGNDHQNVNGEYVIIENGGGKAVNLTGWTLRDTSHRSFRFPEKSIINPGQRIIVRAGKGANSKSEYFFGSPTPMFDNYHAYRFIGDGAFLLDEFGNMRHWFIYP
jgi:micrococcal nuclease